MSLQSMFSIMTLLPLLVSNKCTMKGEKIVDMVRPLMSNFSDPHPATGMLSTLLEEHCQFLNKDFVCCTLEQVHSLNGRLRLLTQIIGRCPACVRNFRQLFCYLTCSPQQSEFFRTKSFQDDLRFVEIAYMYVDMNHEL